ncbi:MAG: MFS transporter [Kofleriaceae bacterium]
MIDLLCRWHLRSRAPRRLGNAERSAPRRGLATLALLTLLLGLAAPVALAAPGPTSGDAPASAVGAPASAAPAPDEPSAAAPPRSAAAPAPAKKLKSASITGEILPILILVLVIIFVVSRLPKVELGHTPAFRRRRLLNWLPLGLTYAFLYMGRYNLAVLKTGGGISQADFGNVDAIGSIVYGVSFLLNGPLADRLGGRATILIAAAGALVANAAIGLLMATGNMGDSPVTVLTLLFSANMYFQSFGAVSIVKVNSAWFHLRERGVFGGIFGILISLGLYFAFDWGARIYSMAPAQWLFFTPAMILALFWVLSFLFVRDRPSEAGFADFDPGDASSGDNGPAQSAWSVIKRMLTHKIILTIAFIELCSGFLRQGILKWYRDFAAGIGAGDSFVSNHWGMVSCIAGITGGIFAGMISDHLFQSRRGPVSAVLYGLMVGGALLIIPMLAFPGAVSWIIAVMAMAIIGVHGMLSGVASQDFGGRRHAGTATGLIDGFVYLGTALQSFTYGRLLPAKGSAAAKDPGEWLAWPGAMLPVAVLGMYLAMRIWNAHATKQPPSKPS